MTHPVSAVGTGSRTARGEATEERLLAAARHEIIENNGAMELAAVVMRAGVSPGLPYRYFDSKSALVVAVVEAYFDALDERVYRPVFTEVSDDWWEREKARVEELVNFFYEEPLTPHLMSRLAGDAAVARAKQERIRRQVRGATANVNTGKKLGRVPADADAEVCGAFLIGGAHQAIDIAVSRDPRMPRARVSRAIREAMRNVLGIRD
ncbi:TetR/AcrR family transcriptional regulator [Mycobacterium spongiae]|uniref:TetR family transcriptional regulator n=1 Tax=Mycobacterium spongiae TaxID=886343 RepID=A0A975JXH2_9MYCO|nr:TetR/AcrR family transcriptional regulator [Mycobacterium spongiae]QUR67130.1 TetR family transcriptional regulator [Mycobacterium spongiae]